MKVQYHVLIHTDLVPGLNPVLAVINDSGRVTGICVDDPIYHGEEPRAFLAGCGIDLRERESTAADIEALKAFIAPRP